MTRRERRDERLHAHDCESVLVVCTRCGVRQANRKGISRGVSFLGCKSCTFPYARYAV